MLSRLPFPELLDAFASTSPTPGGGSAAALSGALGASLLAMVAGLPKTRQNTDEERQTLDAARTRLLSLAETLRELIDRDAASYDGVVAAYRLPKSTDSEKAERQAAVQQALQRATSVPLDTLAACTEALTPGREVARAGNASAITDVAVGVQLLMTGTSAAMLNIQVNLDAVKDDAFKGRVTADVRRHLETGSTAMREILMSAEFVELNRQSGKVFGFPPHGEPPSAAGAVRAIAVMLRRLGPDDARRALDVLAGSTNSETATAAREALTKSNP
jgi:formiminotetrahydrofolate cyclodeaminase